MALVPIGLRIPSDLRDQIRDAARQDGLSVSRQMVVLCEEAIRAREVGFARVALDPAAESDLRRIGDIVDGLMVRLASRRAG